jgi:hypothetical protein
MQDLQMDLFNVFEDETAPRGSNLLINGANIIYIIAAFLSRGTVDKSFNYNWMTTEKILAFDNQQVATLKVRAKLILRSCVSVDMGMHCFNFARRCYRVVTERRTLMVIRTWLLAHANNTKRRALQYLLRTFCIYWGGKIRQRCQLQCS